MILVIYIDSGRVFILESDLLFYDWVPLNIAVP